MNMQWRRLAAASAAAALLTASAAACGTPQASTPTSPHVTAAGACPSAGSPMPGGTRDEVDYADLFRYASQTYLGVAASVASVRTTPAGLGPVVTRVRCSLSAIADDQRQPPSAITNGTATALAVGTPVYEVRGYSPRCRLAAYLGHRLHVYLAQHDSPQGRTTLPCAVSPSGPPDARTSPG